MYTSGSVSLRDLIAFVTSTSVVPSVFKTQLMISCRKFVSDDLVTSTAGRQSVLVIEIDALNLLLKTPDPVDGVRSVGLLT